MANQSEYYPAPRVYPIGARIPGDTPHAVSVSLPTVEDVVEFSESNPIFLSKMEGGYPRFRIDRLVERVIELAAVEEHSGRSVFAFCSPEACEDAIRDFNLDDAVIDASGAVPILTYNKDPLIDMDLKSRLKLTGKNPSSRRAEVHLDKLGILPSMHREERELHNPIDALTSTMKAIYGSDQDVDIILSNTGMNAVYTAFEAVNTLHYDNRDNRSKWIGLGTLYSDTVEMLDTFTREPHHIPNVLELEELSSWLNIVGDKVAGVIVEAPSNPLLETPSLPELSQLLRAYDIPLIVDISVAGCAAVDVTDYADIIVESLTKFASGGGDIMMGSLAIPESSPYSGLLSMYAQQLVERPFTGDVERLAHQIKGYRERVARIGANTLQVVEGLGQNPNVEQLLWSGDKRSADNYAQIARQPELPAGVVSIVGSGNPTSYYDGLKMPKGLSFGTDFSLSTLYVYITHYWDLTSKVSRQRLISQGMDPRIVRTSIGQEDPSVLLDIFQSALRKSAD